MKKYSVQVGIHTHTHTHDMWVGNGTCYNTEGEEPACLCAECYLVLALMTAGFVLCHWRRSCCYRCPNSRVHDPPLVVATVPSNKPIVDDDEEEEPPAYRDVVV